MTSMSESILKEANALPEGAVITPKAMLHLGSRAAVDQALSRLARSGHLLRISRGSYVVPVKSRFGVRPPSASKVVESLSGTAGEAIVSHGAAAANALGLTTQVPIRSIFLTASRGKHLKLGSQILEIRHAPFWQMTMPRRPAGEAIRAISWLGEKHAREALSKLKNTLPETEWQALSASRSILPSWMAKAVSEAVAHG
ncbi:MAG: hypothetical protein JJ959_07015 [Nisaea sp.]|uniref:DUF6088 family protein n=1 Tax=Nisaea sp. TaxID=2024842 RepID=UPI001B29BAB8|nr:DUF6088 family protein [Nisaea sp.]MBO6560270.1 hypothetical protein [Nisaea sp.]